VRRWFDGEGFLEVETPARVPSPGQEIHLDAVPADAGRFLITSPEYHMKRLVAAGFGRIVQICRSWRAGERGPHHEPEFTMVEWYRAGAPLEDIARDCERLIRHAAQALVDPAAIDPARLDLAAPFERTTVAAVVREHAGIDVRGDETADDLRARAAAVGVDVRGARDWDDVFFQVWLDRVDPHLGRGRPTFVFDWPAPLGALARRKPGNPAVVERFELYAGGLELANAFGELTDAVEQRARFEAESAVRAARGKAVYPLDEKLLRALATMPPTSGIALGFDRLVMFLLGASAVRDVMAFADDEV